MDAATEAKTAVEDAQRELRRSREEKGERFVPRFFTCRDGRWVPKIRLARCNCAMPSLRFAQPTAGKRCRVDSIDRGFHVGSGITLMFIVFHIVNRDFVASTHVRILVDLV